MLFHAFTPYIRIDFFTNESKIMQNILNILQGKQNIE